MRPGSAHTDSPGMDLPGLFLKGVAPVDDRQVELERLAKEAERLGHTFFALFVDASRMIRSGDLDIREPLDRLNSGYNLACADFTRLTEEWFYAITGQPAPKKHVN